MRLLLKVGSLMLRLGLNPARSPVGVDHVEHDSEHHLTWRRDQSGHSAILAEMEIPSHGSHITNDLAHHCSGQISVFQMN